MGRMHHDVTFVCPSGFVWVYSMTIVVSGYCEALFHVRKPHSTTRTRFDVRRREGARHKEVCGRVFNENASYTRASNGYVSKKTKASNHEHDDDDVAKDDYSVDDVST